MSDFFDSPQFRDTLKKYQSWRAGGQGLYLEPDDYADIAEYYQSIGNDGESLIAIDEALRIFPNATAPLVSRCHLALLQGDTDTAKRYAAKVSDRSDPDYLMLQGEILLADQQVDEADGYYEQLLATYPAEERLRFIIDAATIFADYNAMDLARKWWDRCKPMAPDADWPRNEEENVRIAYEELEARLLLAEGHYEESLALFNRLVGEEPYSGYFWNQIATCQYMLGQLPESISSLEYALAINPHDREALLNKANALMAQHDDDGALNCYRRYTELTPDDGIGHYYQAVCLTNLNEPQEALRHIETAERLADDRSDALTDILQEKAYILSQLNRLDDALTVADRLDGIVQPPQEAMVLRGNLYLTHQRLDEAQACFDRAAEESHHAAPILLKIAISVYDNHFVGKAYQLLQALKEQEGDGYTAADAYLALCAHDLGMRDEYLDYLQRAVRQQVNEARQVLGHLFPDDLHPNDYYTYAKNEANNPPL